jgi:hypothetical protein
MRELQSLLDLLRCVSPAGIFVPPPLYFMQILKSHSYIASCARPRQASDECCPKHLRLSWACVAGMHSSDKSTGSKRQGDKTVCACVSW